MTDEMEKVKPFLRCVDYWAEEIPPEKLAAYKQLIADGLIKKHHVVYNERSGSTVIEYYSTIPHEWILDELKRAVTP